jgi:hypothetical protein
MIVNITLIIAVIILGVLIRIRIKKVIEVSKPNINCDIAGSASKVNLKTKSKK